jgi:hypothetical protein
MTGLIGFSSGFHTMMNADVLPLVSKTVDARDPLLSVIP